MVYVLTIDQRRSRSSPDRVEHLLATLNADTQSGRIRDFERTAGDELQGVLDEPGGVVDIALSLARTTHWSIGIGVGRVREPLPQSTRAGAGPAFEAAREAVNEAKNAAGRVAVRGNGPRCADIEVVLQLLAALAIKRSDAAVEAGALLAVGMTQAQAAAALGITQQAVSHRLRSGLWQEDQRVREYVKRLLGEADS